MAEPLVHFITRKPLVQNSRVFKQVRSLREAGYDVLLVGVARGALPEREVIDGTSVRRVSHDPLPRSLSRWLRRHGGSPAMPPPAAEAGGGRLRGGALRLAGRAGTPAWLLQSVFFYARVIAMLLRQPRPAIVQATDLNALPAAVVVARLRGAHLVYDAQELTVGMHSLPPAYRRLLAVQERLLLRLVDRFLVVNPAIGEVLAGKHGRVPDAVVLNCPPRGDGPPPRAEREGPPVAVYSGGLLPGRGLEQLLEAVRLVPDLRLLIVGEGPLRDALERQAASEGLAGRVELRPFVPFAALTEVLAQADVGVVPYRDLGLNQRLCSPSKLFHYIAAGLPLAASDLPFVRSVVAGHDLGLLFDPEDPAAMARTICDVLADRERYAARARDAATRFCWEREERTYLAVYASLNGRP